MSTYQELQENLFNKIESSAGLGRQLSTIVPKVDNYTHDRRLCLTGVAFLSAQLQQRIAAKVIEPLAKADPAQYYYLPSSLHLTIQNVRASNHPPTFNEADIKKSQVVFRKVIPRHDKIQFELKDILSLPTSLSVRAYCNISLRDLVLELRQELNASGVPDDKEYASSEVFFGNVTFCRFTKAPNQEFQQLAQNLKNIQVGTMTVDMVSLITTNPGCHPQRTTIIESFQLRPPT